MINKLTFNDNILRAHCCCCDVSVEVVRPDSDLTGILSSIRQSEREEGERLSSFRQHSAIFPPLVGGPSSKDTTGEYVALSCGWSSHTVSNSDCSSN